MNTDMRSQGTQQQRPLSPHLTIYKPQITSVMSILHRLTGFGLFIGLLLLVWYVIFVVYCLIELEVDATTPWIFNNLLVKSLLFAWSLSLFYHLLNGIRHLFWDMGKGFTLKSVNCSGVLVFICTFVLTVGCWHLAYSL